MAGIQSGKPRGSVRKSPPTMPKVASKAPRAAPRKKRAAAPIAAPGITPQEWQQMVATAAYLRAEARGFVGGSAEQDWLDAEAELMAKVGGIPSA